MAVKKTGSFALRLIAVLALVVLVFAACGKDEGVDNTGGGTDNGGGTDYTLTNEGHLTVGSDIPYPPFEFE
ncbi:MAG TPA: ABC transporter substrate-binding protein, partial [Actinomycetota bacterium]|nr:ABC transporter substrate-binding protein [Actinomycetota bacterium]